MIVKVKRKRMVRFGNALGTRRDRRLASIPSLSHPFNLRSGLFFFPFFEGEREREGEEGGGMRCREGRYDRRLIPLLQLALDGFINPRWILREKGNCKQSVICIAQSANIKYSTRLINVRCLLLRTPSIFTQKETMV